MSVFRIQNLEDNSIIEIIAINIDNENNILVKEGNNTSIINITDFKDMLLGTHDGDQATYKILD